MLMVPLTPLHVGSGREAGAVDLPVQRDPIGYPVIWGSSVKGALRSFMSRNLAVKREVVTTLFGPERGEGELEIGRMFVSDFRLLAISGGCGLGGCLYTSRYLLMGFREILRLLTNLSSRYKEYLDVVEEILRGANDERIVYLSSEPGEGIVGLGGGIYVSNNGEGLRYRVYEWLRELFEKVLSEIYGGGSLAEWFSKRVVLLPDNLAVDIIGKRLVMKITRVALDYERKRVREGALWSEEAVPEYSVFAGTFMFQRNGNGESPYKLFREAVCPERRECSFYVVVGGHETIGRGLVRMRVVGGGGSV